MNLKKIFTDRLEAMRKKRRKQQIERHIYQALNEAITRGETKRAMALAQDEHIDLNLPPQGIKPAMSIALKHGSDQIFEFLLENGADPNQEIAEHTPGVYQFIPLLSLAIVTGRKNAALALLRHPEINPAQRGEIIAAGVHGAGFAAKLESPMQLAKKYGMKDVAKLISQKLSRQRRQYRQRHIHIP